MKLVILIGIAYQTFKYLRLRKERRKQMAIFQYEMKAFMKDLKRCESIAVKHGDASTHDPFHLIRGSDELMEKALNGMNPKRTKAAEHDFKTQDLDGTWPIKPRRPKTKEDKDWFGRKVRLSDKVKLKKGSDHYDTYEDVNSK